MQVDHSRILMDGINDVVFVMKVESDFLFTFDFLNRAAMSQSGLTNDILGKSLHEVFLCDRADFLHNYYKQAVISRDIVTYENSYITLEDKRFYETKLVPLFNNKSECTKLVATITNVTKRKESEFEISNLLEELKKSKNSYESLFHHNSDAILSFDLNGIITHANVAIESITGYKPVEIIGSTLCTLVVKEDILLVRELFMQAISEITGSSQLAMLHKIGDRIEVSLKITPLVIDDEVVGVYGMLEDITDLTHSLKKLEESEERFRIITENASDLITLIDNEGEIIYASTSYESILGFDHNEYIANLFLYNIDPDDRTVLSKDVLEALERGKPFTFEFNQFNAKGKLIWYESHGTPVWDEQNKFKHMVVLTKDISEQKEYEAKLEHFAYHDFLSGLPNRTLLEERFTNALIDFKKNEDGLAVIMMDIDYFKKINDVFGHDIGDEVIKIFGQRVRKNIRNIDTVARIGGDEFILLLPEVGSKENAISIAEDIQKSIREPWEIHGHILNVTTSMGIAMAPPKGAKKESIIKEADTALYKAKDAGRNKIK